MKRKPKTVQPCKWCRGTVVGPVSLIGHKLPDQSCQRGYSASPDRLLEHDCGGRILRSISLPKRARTRRRWRDG